MWFFHLLAECECLFLVCYSMWERLSKPIYLITVWATKVVIRISFANTDAYGLGVGVQASKPKSSEWTHTPFTDEDNQSQSHVYILGPFFWLWISHQAFIITMPWLTSVYHYIIIYASWLRKGTLRLLSSFLLHFILLYHFYLFIYLLKKLSTTILYWPNYMNDLLRLGIVSRIKRRMRGLEG